MKKSSRRVAALVSAALLSCSLFSCSGERAAMTCGESSITEGMYSYWLSAYKTNFLYTYADGQESDSLWKSEISGGVTYADYAEAEIGRTIKNFAVGIELFRQYGLKISSDVSAQISSDIQEKIDYAGSRPALNSELAKLGINIEGLRDVYVAEEKWQAVYDYLYGENGVEKVSDAEIDSYYKEYYSCLGLIVFYTESKRQISDDGSYVYDSEGNISVTQMTETEKAEKKQLISDTADRLGAGEDLSVLAAECSDEDLSSYDCGCLVGSDMSEVYGTLLVTVAAEMSVGETRRVDDSGITYLVQKRELPERDSLSSADKAQIEKLEDNAINKAYTEKFNALSESVVTDTEIIEKHPVESAPLNSYF